MRHYMRTLLACFLLLSLELSKGYGQEVQSSQYITDEINQWVDKEYENNQKKYGEDPDYFVRRGLLASRKKQRVEVLAVATGLKQNDPVEFLVVAQAGKDYESIAVTPAKPSDIIAATEFIGLERGHPVDFSKRYFWPKGERVFITYHWRMDDDDGTSTTEQSVRAEELVIDSKWKKPLPQLGYRFIGSTWRKSTTPEGQIVCKADSYGDVVAIFNSPWAAFDVPYPVEQQTVYGSLVPNSDYPLKKRQKLRIHIRPEYMDGTRRIADYLLRVMPATDSPPPTSLQDAEFTLSALSGDPEYKKGTFSDVLDYIQGIYQSGKEPFLKMQFGESLPINVIRDFCAMLKRILEQGILFVEPDNEHFYFEAFLPQTTWKDPLRRNHPTQPVEVFIDGQTSGTTISGELVQYEMPKKNGNEKLNSKRVRFKSEAELVHHINSGKPWDTNGIFMHVDPDFPYGPLLRFYKQIRVDFPTVFVFTTQRNSTK